MEPYVNLSEDTNGRRILSKLRAVSQIGRRNLT